MRHDVRRARLPRELEILAIEHVPVKSESKFHGRNFLVFRRNIKR